MTFIEPDGFRLEPLARDPTLREGLRMAIADPAWMLARQRQFGELTAHDAGSPAAATLARETAPLTRYLPRLPDGTAGQQIDAATRPLEALVEHDLGPEAGSNALWAAFFGLHYRRLLAADAATTPTVAAYLAAVSHLHALAVPPSAHPLLQLLQASGGLDGLALHRDLAATGTGLPAGIPVDEAARPAVVAAGQRYLAYCDSLAAGPVTGEHAWDAARCEYQFSIAGPTLGGELVFEATEYDSGHLDWHSLDISAGTLQAAGDSGAATLPSQTVLPAPVTFPGMPAARLWMFEDSAVNLDRLQAAAEDVGALLVLEFALSASDQFYVIPLALEAGSAWRISLQVTDSFGITTDVRAASRPRLFVHDGDASLHPWGMLFPAAVGARSSPPHEQIDLLRDELGNRCWAVERIAPDASGLPVDRDAAIAAARAPSTPVPAADGLRYALRSTVAGNWYPLLPTDSDLLRLRLGRLDDQPAPGGHLLSEMAATELPAEEVSRAGKRVVRAWQWARGADGAQHLWIGRRVSPAPPVASPRLEFDLADSVSVDGGSSG